MYWVIGTIFIFVLAFVIIKLVVNTEENQIIGNVIYIDNYGNVVSNITRKLFKDVGKGRPFEISARNYKFKKVYDRYSDSINFSIEKHKREEDGKKLRRVKSSVIREERVSYGH